MGKPFPHRSTIVTLGAGWAAEYEDLIEFAARHEARAAWLVHDLLPITHGNRLFAPRTRAVLERWLAYIVRHNGLLLTNSTNTKNELEAFCTSKGLRPNVHALKFPQEFTENTTRVEAAPFLTEAVKSPYALCVGTIEARKNVLTLLHAWNDLSAVRGGNLPNLILAGRWGWMVEPVREFLRTTQNVGGKVIHVDGANDAELELLYQNCEFTVFPSLAEGWGLPVGESLWFGKNVICANTSSMPEVGGQFATYFDHDRPASLTRAIKTTLDAPKPLPPNIRDHLITWDETARSLLRILAEPAKANGDAAPSVLST